MQVEYQGYGSCGPLPGAASFEMTRLNREVRLDHPKEKVQGLQRHQGMTGELIFLITRRPREGHSVEQGRTVDLGIVAGHRVWPGMGLMGFCPRLTGLWPRDVLKKVSRGLSRVEAGNPGFPRLVQVTSGGFSWWL